MFSDMLYGSWCRIRRIESIYYTFIDRCDHFKQPILTNSVDATGGVWSSESVAQQYRVYMPPTKHTSDFLNVIIFGVYEVIKQYVYLVSEIDWVINDYPITSHVTGC